MEPNAGPPCEEPQNFECLFLFANKATVTLVISATRGCSTSLKITGHERVTSQITKNGYGIEKIKIGMGKGQ